MFMAKYTQAQHEAIKRYRENRESISITLTKEQKDKIKEKASAKNMNVTQYILSLVDFD